MAPIPIVGGIGAGVSLVADIANDLSDDDDKIQ